MIIERLSEKDFVILHNDLVKNGFVCMQSDDSAIVHDYLKEGMSVRYVVASEGFFPPEMEIKFSKDELDKEQLESRMKLELTGLDVYFSSIEGNIAFKEELLKSEKDMEDAKHLRIIYEGKFDEKKINLIKEKIRRLRLNER